MGNFQHRITRVRKYEICRGDIRLTEADRRGKNNKMCACSLGHAFAESWLCRFPCQTRQMEGKGVTRAETQTRCFLSSFVSSYRRPGEKTESNATSTNKNSQATNEINVSSLAFAVKSLQVASSGPKPLQVSPCPPLYSVPPMYFLACRF